MTKILAIDDKPDNLVVISTLLKSLMPDIKVLTAQSGRGRLELARKEQPDTILLDVKMPGMDGYEVCRQLKANPELKMIPVIMLTASMAESELKEKMNELSEQLGKNKKYKDYS